MKKALQLLIVLAVVFSMVGCSTGGKDTKKTSESVSVTESASVTEGATETKVTDAAETPPEELSGKIVVWSSGDELSRFVEGFNKIYPNIEVDITVIPNADFLTKLEPALASGADAPDIFTGESDYVKYLVDTDYWQDLSGEPYNIGQYKDNIWDYVLNVGTDNAGAVKALSFQASPGSVIYRRDIALKYLGTDDPKEISAKLSSYDKMLEVAQTLQTASDGKVKMFASWQDIYNMQFSNRSSGWVVDDTLQIDPTMKDFFDIAKTITEKGYDLNTDPWSGVWSAAVESEDTFCYVLPTWGYQFLVKPNAVTTSGKWALAEGPVPYVKGGTWLGIWKDSPNKELAWKFLEYATCNADSLKAYAKEYGEYVSLKSVDKDLATEKGEDVLGGQNLYEFYNEEMTKVPANSMTAYDGQINSMYLNAVKAYASNALGLEDALQQFKDDVSNAYPNIKVN